MGNAKEPTRQYEILDRNGCPVKHNILTTMIGEITFGPNLIGHRNQIPTTETTRWQSFFRVLTYIP